MIVLDEQTKDFVEDIYNKIETKLKRSAVLMRDIIPYTTENGQYNDMSKIDINWWTNGFFGGMMWLMYSQTHNEVYKITAEKQEEILDKAMENFEIINHDIGFMWGLTSKANYLLTGNKKSRLKAIYMANVLAARTNVKSGYIRAWNAWGKDTILYSIIDCMMNLPILYWTSEEINDKRFSYFATMQADMTMKEHIREDGSVYHICVHNEEKPLIVDKLGGQGYSKESAWTRGVSWAVYGFVLSYIYTNEKKYLDTAMHCADYFLKNAEKENYKVLTDFSAPENPKYYDTSAAACTACGLIEIYKATNDMKYLYGAVNLIKALVPDMDFSEENQSILQNSMESYSSGEELHLIYGDFYLTEAILKLKGNDFLIW